MSLVNMLKDLDQRRQGTSSAGAAADLIPAADKPKSGFFARLFKLLIVLLFIGGAGIGYLYFEEGGFEGLDVSQTLNIIPDFIPMPSQFGEEEDQFTPAPGVARDLGADRLQQQNRIVPSSTPAQSQPATVNASGAQNSGALVANNAVVSSRQMSSDLRDASTISQNSTSSIVPSQASATQTASNEQPAATAQGQGEADVSTPAANEAAQPANNAVAGEGSAASQPQSESVDTAGGNASATASVRNLPPSETVKNYAQMSPEERDTLAVQYALQLIQDNNSIQAYASLEEHVMQNRYAHQSRETYAKLLVNDGNLLAARNLVESGLQLAPNHPGFKKVKARILIGNGDSAEAANVLSSRAPPVHEDIEYHELLATAQLASRDFEGAQLSYTGLVRQDQSQGRWWYGLAAAYDSLGNRQSAVQAYNRAAAQNNLSPNLRRRVQERLTVLVQ